MRTLPANFSTGLSNNYRMVWLVKLTGSAATYYWLTNKTGRTATSDVALTESTVAKTYDSSLLAKSVNNSGLYAISEIEQNIDISMGGAVGSSSDVDLTLLNQLRLDTTLAGYGLENRAVSIYCGFIPDGATPTLEVTDMVCLWTGVFDSHEEDYSQTICYLKDARDQRHKLIPQTIIDKETYPYAPDESIGQVLPILYGDFIVAGLDVDNIYFEMYSLVPAICINKIINDFVVAGHITHTTGGVYYHDGNMKAPAKVYSYDGANFNSPTLSANDSGLSTIIIPQGQIAGLCYQLLSRSAQGNTITDYDGAIDGDMATYAELPNTAGQRLELCADGLSSGAFLGTGGISPYLYFDTIVSADSFQWGYIDGDDVETKVDLAAGNTFVYSTFVFTAITAPSELIKYRYFVRDNADHTPSAETVKIYGFGIFYYVLIADNITTPQLGRIGLRNSGYRRSGR
jgi:hypothetical protein